MFSFICSCCSPEVAAVADLFCVFATRNDALDLVGLPPLVRNELRLVPPPTGSLFGKPLRDAVHNMQVSAGMLSF
jgi:hypothetical protein